MQHHRLGLLGYNINYSKSAIIHRTAAELCGVPNLTYEFIDLAPNQLSSLPAILTTTKITAFNITTPHKSVATLAQVLSVRPSPWRSVNTATFNPSHGQWHLTNTDGQGFIAALRASTIHLARIRHLVVLGFGGATQGILQSLFSVHPHNPHCRTEPIFTDPLTITILWRRIKNNHRVSEPLLNELISSSALSPQQLFLTGFTPAHMSQAIQRARRQNEPGSVLLIQATPLPHQGDGMQAWVDALEQQELAPYLGGCMDMCYHPSSALHPWSEGAGVPYASGWLMLLEQARGAQQIWWQRKPELTELLARLPSPESCSPSIT